MTSTNEPTVLGEILASGQLDILAQADELSARRPGPTLTEAFLDFHARNPQVYLTLRTLAREWRRAGKGKCGARMLWETLRWKLSLQIEGDDVFLLNDHAIAFYARALMRFEPDLAGMFDLRRAPEADAWIAQYQRGTAVAA